MIKYCLFRGDTICFSDQGKGRSIILLHGFLEDKNVWKSLAATLSKKYRIICIDLPGFGKSANYGYLHSMSFMAAAVRAVLDHLHLRKIVVVGHSMGGYVGLQLAKEHPKYFKGLCLLNSTSLVDSSEKKRNRRRAINLLKRNPDQFIGNFFNGLFAPENVATFKKEINQLLLSVKKIDVRGIINATEGMIIRENREDVLARADFPILFIAGRKDSVVPFRTIRSQVLKCRQPQLLDLADSGHMSYVEAKDETISALKELARQSFR